MTTDTATDLVRGRAPLDAFSQAARFIAAGSKADAEALLRKLLGDAMLPGSTVAELFTLALRVQHKTSVRADEARREAEAAADKRQFAAIEAGEAAHRAGVSRDAMPAEYRAAGREAEAECWLGGWDIALFSRQDGRRRRTQRIAPHEAAC